MVNDLFNGLETKIGASVGSLSYDRSYIDKTLSRDEAKDILDLIQKEFINKKDQAKLMNLLVSNELKLVNFGDQDRYLVGKYLTWIQDFAGVQDALFNYAEEIDKKQLKISQPATELLERMLHKNSETLKAMINLYLYLTRSGLSLGATGFDTITSQRFEYNYPDQQAENHDNKFLGIFKK